MFYFADVVWVARVADSQEEGVIIASLVSAGDALLVVFHALAPVPILGISAATLHAKKVVVASASVALEVARLESGLRQHDVGVWQSLAVYL